MPVREAEQADRCTKPQHIDRTTDGGGGVWAFCFPGDRQHAESKVATGIVIVPACKRQGEQAAPSDDRQKVRRRLIGKHAPGQHPATTAIVGIGGRGIRTTEGKRPLSRSDSRNPAKVRRPG